MQATWWNRLDVKMPSFCLFMNLFLHWEQLNFLSLLCSCWLNSAALTNLFSQFKQLNVFVWTFVLHSIFRSDPNYDKRPSKWQVTLGQLEWQWISWFFYWLEWQLHQEIGSPALQNLDHGVHQNQHKVSWRPPKSFLQWHQVEHCSTTSKQAWVCHGQIAGICSTCKFSMCHSMTRMTTPLTIHWDIW